VEWYTAVSSIHIYQIRFPRFLSSGSCIAGTDLSVKLVMHLVNTVCM